MALRIIQWATGGVGRAAIEGIAAHPELELAGCWVHSADKVGRDVGELCGLGPLGVQATGDVDALLALEADCVLYSPIMPDPALVARYHAVWQNARRSRQKPDGGVAGQRFSTIHGHAGKRTTVRYRPRACHPPRSRGCHPVDRFAYRTHPAGTRGCPAFHLAVHGAR